MARSAKKPARSPGRLEQNEREEWEKIRLEGEVGTGCIGPSADHDTKEKSLLTQVWVVRHGLQGTHECPIYCLYAYG